jgi:hypothetical protein
MSEHLTIKISLSLSMRVHKMLELMAEKLERPEVVYGSREEEAEALREGQGCRVGRVVPVVFLRSPTIERTLAQEATSAFAENAETFAKLKKKVGRLDAYTVMFGSFALAVFEPWHTKHFIIQIMRLIFWLLLAAAVLHGYPSGVIRRSKDLRTRVWSHLRFSLREFLAKWAGSDVLVVRPVLG